MSRFTRGFGLGLVAGLLAALAMAIPAGATEVKAVCVVSGEVKAFDKQDSTIGVRYVGGKGSFDFAPFVVACVGVSKGVPDARVMDAAAEGVFESVVCGTGKAWGIVTGLVGPAKYRNLIVGEKFAIHFIATKGPFFWHKTKLPKGPELKDSLLDEITKPNGGEPKLKYPKAWHPAGMMKLDPPTQKEPRTKQPPGNCTKGFTVTGAIVIAEN